MQLVCVHLHQLLLRELHLLLVHLFFGVHLCSLHWAGQIPPCIVGEAQAVPPDVGGDEVGVEEHAGWADATPVVDTLLQLKSIEVLVIAEGEQVDTACVTSQTWEQEPLVTDVALGSHCIRQVIAEPPPLLPQAHPWLLHLWAQVLLLIWFGHPSAQLLGRCLLCRAPNVRAPLQLHHLVLLLLLQHHPLLPAADGEGDRVLLVVVHILVAHVWREVEVRPDCDDHSAAASPCCWSAGLGGTDTGRSTAALLCSFFDPGQKGHCRQNGDRKKSHEGWGLRWKAGRNFAWLLASIQGKELEVRRGRRKRMGDILRQLQMWTNWSSDFGDR